MCGIAGFFKAFGRVDAAGMVVKNDYRPFLPSAELTELALTSWKHAQAQGRDASGLFLGKWAEKYAPGSSPLPASLKMMRAPGPAAALMETEKFKSAFRIEIGGNNTTFVVCHTRMGTSGSPQNNLNNHPFVSGQVVGVHNGVIRNDGQLAKRFDLSLKGECDSEVIFALLDKFISEGSSPELAIRKVDALLQGWYVVFFTLKSDVTKLYVFNRSGSLSLVSLDKQKVCFFASSALWVTDAIKEVESSRKIPRYVAAPALDDCKVHPLNSGYYCAIDTLVLDKPSDILEGIRTISSIPDATSINVVANAPATSVEKNEEEVRSPASTGSDLMVVNGARSALLN